MKIYQLILAIIIAIFCVFGFFNTMHFKPIGSFFSEIQFFLAAFFTFLLLLQHHTKILIPIALAFFFLIFIIYSDHFYSFYAYGLFVVILIGLNLKNLKNHYLAFSLLILLIGLASIISAIHQWLGLPNVDFILSLVGNRPYANFAQPNHLATFLFLSLLSVYYLFENKKISTPFAFILAMVFLWGIVLTQSRTAWLTIIVLAIFLLFKSQKNNLKISKYQIALIFSSFWLMVLSLPFVNQFLSQFFNIVLTADLVERATTGYLRLNIWNQMIHAIWEKPWFGYGWGQTTAAQYAVIDRYPGTEWASSAHNIILDILVWCGIPIGLTIIFYSATLYFKFLIKSKSIETITAILMITVVLIHAMLEYPLHYAYFLLPVGFLCGICLREFKLKTLAINHKWGYLIVIVGFIAVYQVFKEYDQITDNMVAAHTHEMNDFKTKIELPYTNSIFFKKYEDRAKWVAQYPYMKVDQSILDLADRNLKTFLTPYDLHKYAILLAHNGQKVQAERQLKILKIMYNQSYQYSQLFVKTPTVNVPLNEASTNFK